MSIWCAQCFDEFSLHQKPLLLNNHSRYFTPIILILRMRSLKDVTTANAYFLTNLNLFTEITQRTVSSDQILVKQFEKTFSLFFFAN